MQKPWLKMGGGGNNFALCNLQFSIGAKRLVLRGEIKGVDDGGFSLLNYKFKGW